MPARRTGKRLRLVETLETCIQSANGLSVVERSLEVCIGGGFFLMGWIRCRVSRLVVLFYFLGLAACGLLVLGGSTCLAQASPVESVGYRLQAFGMYSAAQPNYQPNGVSSFNGTGATLGVAITHAPIGIFQPGLEVRGSYATGSQVRLRSITPGPRVAVRLGRWEPYADFLIGVGDVYFQHPTVAGYLQNNSVVYSAGGGLDFAVTPRFAARADFQEQFWKLDSNPGSAFHPSWFSVGVVYQFPFRRSGR